MYLSAGVGCAVSGDRQRLGCGSPTRHGPLGELLACPRALPSRRSSRRVLIGILAPAMTPRTTAMPPRRLHGRCADCTSNVRAHTISRFRVVGHLRPNLLIATEMRFRRQRRLDGPRTATTQNGAARLRAGRRHAERRRGARISCSSFPPPSPPSRARAPQACRPRRARRWRGHR